MKNQNFQIFNQVGINTSLAQNQDIFSYDFLPSSWDLLSCFKHFLEQEDIWTTNSIEAEYQSYCDKNSDKKIPAEEETQEKEMEEKTEVENDENEEENEVEFEDEHEAENEDDNEVENEDENNVKNKVEDDDETEDENDDKERNLEGYGTGIKQSSDDDDSSPLARPIPKKRHSGCSEKGRREGQKIKLSLLLYLLQD